MSLLRATALLAALLLVAGCGRKPAPPKKPTPPKPATPLPSADEKALQQLAQQVFAAFVNGDSAKFQSLTVAALAASELETALRTVRKKEARQFIARLEAIPPNKRNALQLDTLRLSKAFLANPKTAFANEWLELQVIISELGKTQLQFFQNLTSTNAPLDWARASEPSTVIDINPQSDAILPEARVDLVFSAAGKSYRLQLSNCNKLPGHGWRIAEQLRFINLTAEAAAKKMWMEDFPAAQVLAREILLVPILRAGQGFITLADQLLPEARIGYLGIARNETTLQPEWYLEKLPRRVSRFEIIICDPMLATGGSAIAAGQLLEKRGAKNLRFIHALAAPEGVRALRKHFPKSSILTAALDEKLNENGYIVPGLGDAGDRCFGC